MFIIISYTFLLLIKVPIPSNLQLYATCNVTVWNAIGSSYNGSLNCSSSCGRGQCVSGYRESGLQCGNFNRLLFSNTKATFSYF
jgi:hypothetical protein